MLIYTKISINFEMMSFLLVIIYVKNRCDKGFSP